MIRFLTEETDNNLYQQLIDFSEGNISHTEIDDKLIEKVNPNGTVIINFGGVGDFLDIFEDVLGYGDKHNIDCAFNYYCDFNIFDEYQISDDWTEGFLLRNVYGESEESLKKILRILSPRLIAQMFGDDDAAWKNASELLRDTFSREVQDIISDYTSNLNENAEAKLIAEVEKELCDVFEDIKIFLFGRCFNKYYTTVKSLLKLYRERDDFQVDLKGLLINYVKENVDLTSFTDDMYSHYEYLNQSDFQSTLTKNLENMLEKLEDSDMFLDIEGFKELTKIISKYDYNKWYSLPKDKTMSFRIIRIIPETNLIQVDIRNKSTDRILSYEVDYEQFNLILYQPELFRKFYD